MSSVRKFESSILMLATMCTALWSCRPGAGHPVEKWHDERDKIEEISLVSIDEELPPLHSLVHMLTLGDTLIIMDNKSQDRLFHAYDVNKNKYIGSFGKFGNGPGEMAYIGGIYLDDKGILYGLNTAQMKLQGVDVKMALKDEEYKAFQKTRLDESGYLVLFSSPHFINDSTVICSLFTNDASEFVTHVGKFNPNNGATSVVVSIPSAGNGRSLIAVAPDKDLIVETSMLEDRIRLFDMDGKLSRTIYGPDYGDKDKTGISCFSDPIIAGDRIYVNYNGEHAGTRTMGTDIIVMDLDGKYLKTLRFDAPLGAMIYHEKSNRLYLSTEGEPQFGYLQLD